MKKILEDARYLVILAVISSLVGSIGLFVWASAKTPLSIYHLFGHGMSSLEEHAQTTHFVAIVDSFLLAVILYIFAIALYELFIGDLRLSDCLIIKDLDWIKKKLLSVIALMLAVTFLEHVAEWKDPKGSLMFAVAIAVGIAALVFYMRGKGGGRGGLREVGYISTPSIFAPHPGHLESAITFSST